MSIKSVGITIVAFILIGALVSMIAPKGKMENSIKFILSLGFVFVIITTVFNLKIELPKLDYDKVSVSNNDIYELSLETTKNLLINKIKSRLSDKNIELQHLQINANILQDKSIIIDSVIYIAEEENNIFAIENVILEITGCKNIKRKNNEEFITK